MRNRTIVLNNKQYKVFHLTYKQHDKLFPNRPRKWGRTFRYYYSKEDIVILRVVSMWGKLAATILFPFMLIFNGLANTKEMGKELAGMWFPIKHKTYVMDACCSKSKIFDDIMEVLGENASK